MKIISMGGGALQVQSIRLSKGITASDFMQDNPEDGADILAKLKERSNKLSWADDIGRINWTNRRGDIYLWFLTNEVSG